MDLLTQIVILITVPLFLSWVFRTAQKTAVVAGSSFELRYAWNMRAVAYLALAMVVIIGGLGVVAPPDADERMPYIGLLVGFGLVAAYLLAETATVVVVNPSGIRSTTVFGRRRMVAWTEISVVRWGSVQKGLILKAHDGTRITVSPFRTGFFEFLLLLRTNVGSVAEPAAAAAEQYARRMASL